MTAPPAAGTAMSAGTVAPAAPAAAAWRRARTWVALVLVVVLGAVVVGLLDDTPRGRLDPRSPAPEGAKALTRVVEGYGTRVVRATSVDDTVSTARGGRTVVLVAAPDDYPAARLRRLVRAAPVVLVEPGAAALRAVAPRVDARDDAPADTPGCALPAATAAGRVPWPDDARVYGGDGTSCYGGAVVRTGRVTVLGSGTVLTNDAVDAGGSAALGVNLLTADRTATTLVWLLPGADADGAGGASVWSLFPDGVRRAVLALVVVGVLLLLWRGRRLGPAVAEPLPVVVRAAEVVEGHGRMSERAGARDRAAARLRNAALRRLTRALALPRGTPPAAVADAAGTAAGWPPGTAHGVLLGPAPVNDAALLRLASDLDLLTAAVTTPTKGPR